MKDIYLKYCEENDIPECMIECKDMITNSFHYNMWMLSYHKRVACQEIGNAVVRTAKAIKKMKFKKRRQSGWEK